MNVSTNACRWSFMLISCALPNLTFDGFFALVVAGIAGVDHGGHGKHLSFYIIER